MAGIRRDIEFTSSPGLRPKDVFSMDKSEMAQQVASIRLHHPPGKMLFFGGIWLLPMAASKPS